MDKKEKAVRLVDVGELESSLKKDLTEEEAKGKSADILFCESIEDELSDLENLPTIDPESLRPVSEWELNPHRFSCEHFRCKECHHINCIADNYCGKCGAKIKNAGVKPEELPVPEEENSSAVKSNDGNGEWEWEECGGTE